MIHLRSRLDRHWNEECAVFGIAGVPDASTATFLGLYALQHRGQEAAGIVASDGEVLREVKRLGLVSEGVTEEDLQSLPGTMAIGHNRYSTTGASNRLANVQPIMVDFKGGQLAIAHNGNLVNALELRMQLEEQGAIFQSSSDTEVIVHLLARSQAPTLEDKLAEALGKVRGAYSLVLLGNDRLIAARDPNGFRPLALGRRGPTWIVGSESCAFDLLEAELVREIDPGEFVILHRDGRMESRHPLQPGEPRFCVFEFIYFSRPDSIIGGHSVDAFRRELGRRLAREHPIEADIVISVPDSSNSAALGYAEASGLPFELGLIRNHYVGRTFINPSPSMRANKAGIKYNPVREILDGKRVVVVDDSIVRGTTSRRLVRMLRNAGATEVHFRVSSPPIQWPCYYGIDTPTKSELIAATHSIDEIAAYIGVDSLAYLSMDNLRASGGYPASHYCTACFDGSYAVPWDREPGKNVFEKKANTHAHRESAEPANSSSESS